MKNRIEIILRFIAFFSALGSSIFIGLTAIFALIGDDVMTIYFARTYAALLGISICLYLISEIINRKW